MNTYLMLGSYSPDSLQEADADRTSKIVGIIEDLGGHIFSIYALLGTFDLAVVLRLPSNIDAMKASMAMTQGTGISWNTCPALSVQHFDELLDPAFEDVQAETADEPAEPGFRATDLN